VGVVVVMRLWAGLKKKGLTCPRKGLRLFLGLGVQWLEGRAKSKFLRGNCRFGLVFVDGKGPRSGARGEGLPFHIVGKEAPSLRFPLGLQLLCWWLAKRHSW
jgi:hypothetical protein